MCEIYIKYQKNKSKKKRKEIKDKEGYTKSKSHNREAYQIIFSLQEIFIRIYNNSKKLKFNL